MSYMALATDRFDEVVRFYGDELGLPIVDAWDRGAGRGRRFELGGGMRLEILDNARERTPSALGESGDRLHVVIEVTDIEVTRSGLNIAVPPVHDVSWGARLFALRDPDDVVVTFLQWRRREGDDPPP